MINKNILSFCLFTFPSCSTSRDLTGKVISVADGDTITVLDRSKRQTKIRLYGIDTPEKGQAFGKVAKKYTARLSHKKQAIVEVHETDKYGRTVGVVFVDGINVNEEIIKAGYGWQYRNYVAGLVMLCLFFSVCVSSLLLYF